jgi:hypothetical protein
MSEEMVLTVLNEVLGELQTANRSLKEMGGTIKTLEVRVQAFEQKEIRIDPPDLGPLQEKIDALPGVINGEMIRVDEYMRQQIVAQGAELRNEATAGLSKIAAVVETQPKPIKREFRFSLFPEFSKEVHYRLFLRWLFGAILGAMVINGFFQWLQRNESLPTTSVVESTANGKALTDSTAQSVRPPQKIGNAQDTRNNASRTIVNRMTGQEARKKGDSIVRAEKIKKINKILDTLHNIIIQHISDSLQKNGIKKPQNRKPDDEFSEIH